MGAGGFHGRVRDGIGWGLPAMTTRSSSLSGYQGGRLCFGRPVSLMAGVGFWCLVCVLLLRGLQTRGLQTRGLQTRGLRLRGLRLRGLRLCGLRLCDLRMISMHGVLVVG